MSESQITRKLTESLAHMHEEMSVEQMRLYQAYVTKSLEMREAEEALRMALGDEEGEDESTYDSIREIREVLADQGYRLSGNECVLLACLNKELEGEDYTDTKRINIFLQSYERKPSNTTKIADGLEKKGLIEMNSEGLHSHKMYKLSKRGQRSAWALLDRFTGVGGKLSVMEK